MRAGRRELTGSCDLSAITSEHAMLAGGGQITKTDHGGYWCNRGHSRPVVVLLIPNDLATIVTEVVLELLAVLGYRTAHTTDPPLRPAGVSPRLILLALGVVGAHVARKYSSACFRLRCAVRSPRVTLLTETGHIAH